MNKNASLSRWKQKCGGWLWKNFKLRMALTINIYYHYSYIEFALLSIIWLWCWWWWLMAMSGWCWWGDSLTHAILITRDYLIRPERHEEPRNEVGFQLPAKRIIGILNGNLQILRLTCSKNKSRGTFLPKSGNKYIYIPIICSCNRILMFCEP